MSKTGKIVIFILMIVVLGVLGPLIKGMMVIPYYTIVGLILTLTYQGMFKKINPSENHDAQPKGSEFNSGYINSNDQSSFKGRNSGNPKHNTTNNQPSKNSETETIMRKLFDDLESLAKQREALIKLNRENLFTDAEFNEKMIILQLKEKEIHEKQLDLQIRKEAQQSIENLSSLLAAEVISREEFEHKREQLYASKREKHKNGINQPTYKSIGSINYDQLERWNKQRVKEFIEEQKDGYQILYNSGENKLLCVNTSKRFLI